MKITTDSHTDHALTPAHLAWILERFGDRKAFFAETVEIPAELGALPCGLHGPTMGDEPIPAKECRELVRAGRAGPSRVCARAPRLVRTVTVIGGPHEGACILYTAHGGPPASREPWDPSLDDAWCAASAAFWAEHALSEK